MKFKGNFGELILNISETGRTTGTYQENGTIRGEFVNNTFKGQWENKGMEGLVEFTINGNKLEGNWKKGLNPGAMRGVWVGKIADDTDSEAETHHEIIEATEVKTVEVSVHQIIEALCEDMNQYNFFHFGAMLHYMIEEVGAENTGKAIQQMVKEETHYNLHTSIKHLYDKWGNDDEYFTKFSNLTDGFIEDYIEQYNDRIPNLRRHIAKKAELNFGPAGAVWSMINGYSGYLVKDPEDWNDLKGPVGLAVRLCGCETFDQVIETDAVDEFSKHFTNIFFYTLKEIEELPAIYQQNLKGMLATTIDALYHDDPDWNLEKAQGILTNAIGTLLYQEYGLDFNAYMVEEPIKYSYQDLSQFGVTWISGIEYPVDYHQMAADILALSIK
jgi:hypothetical protein